MYEGNIKKHNNCQMAIRWKLFRNKTTSTPGLFCSEHDVFLDWLSDHVAYDLIDNHHIEVQPYSERKKKKNGTHN
jgi:hypothetical protein